MRYARKNKQNDNDDMFYLTSYYRSKRSANRAKVRILTNNAALNYDIGISLQRYLKRLKKISRINYGCQYPTVHKSEVIYFQNANDLSKIALEDFNKDK